MQRLLLAPGQAHADVMRAAGVQRGFVLLDAANDTLLVHHKGGAAGYAHVFIQHAVQFGCSRAAPDSPIECIVAGT